MSGVGLSWVTLGSVDPGNARKLDFLSSFTVICSGKFVSEVNISLVSSNKLQSVP